MLILAVGGVETGVWRGVSLVLEFGWLEEGVVVSSEIMGSLFVVGVGLPVRLGKMVADSS